MNGLFRLCRLRCAPSESSGKVPDSRHYLVGPASSLLQDKHHGVLISGTKLAIELCKANPNGEPLQEGECGAASVLSLLLSPMLPALEGCA